MQPKGQISNSADAWFCVHSQPKHEHIAAANLRRCLGIEVWNPRVAFTRKTRRGPASVTESLFPGYFFARFDLHAQLDDVRYTPGVASVVHFGNQYPSVFPSIIESLKQSFSDSGIAVLQEEPSPGERAMITDGSFCGFEVVVLRSLPGRRRVQVLLEMLGTAATAEVDLHSLSVPRKYPHALSAPLAAAA